MKLNSTDVISIKIGGVPIKGVGGISFELSDKDALKEAESRVYNAMDVPKTQWSGSFNLKLSKKDFKRLKRYAHVKKYRIPRKLKKLRKWNQKPFQNIIRELMDMIKAAQNDYNPPKT